MRFWKILVIISLALVFSACSSTISSLDGIDRNLPQVKNIKTIPDVSSVAFEWEVINDASLKGYVLYRDDGDGYKEVAYIQNPLASHYVDSGLFPEKDYSYYFHTLSKNAYSSRSEVVKVRTSFINPVESLYASNDYPKKVKLLWNPHPNPSISHYLVQRQEDNSEFKTIGIVNHRLMVEYFDENLNDESSYRYRIVAMDFMENPSRPSKIVTARTKKKPVVSGSITASNNLPTTIVVNWDKINDASSYKIYRSKTIDGAYSMIGSTSNTRFVDNVGSPNVSYYYKVSGVDSTNIESNMSAATKGSTRKIPQTPKIIKGYVDKQEAQIQWEANSDAQYYLVYRKSGLFGDVTRFKINGTLFVDKDMRVGKEYTYYVVAVDEFGLESNNSEEVNLSIK
ncbi:hypothetical protein CCY99_06205 [Helicobacter sp. 16-1353]|uniref:fibronectin type III domain-containing protein n=1 Tax=Helicobacter sp. 16-1353 TaxID=2004996 RepID=UPI000DCB5EE1|nr:fibronectin type III domain-containing protein [Helicobacter sp. 16-1353]RAX53183.1 hypothetical protein CCY99_06205 [Helicobacter sp. 16-1353]